MAKAEEIIAEHRAACALDSYRQSCHTGSIPLCPTTGAAETLGRLRRARLMPHRGVGTAHSVWAGKF